MLQATIFLYYCTIKKKQSRIIFFAFILSSFNFQTVVKLINRAAIDSMWTSWETTHLFIYYFLWGGWVLLSCHVRAIFTLQLAQYVFYFGQSCIAFLLYSIRYSYNFFYFVTYYILQSVTNNVVTSVLHMLHLYFIRVLPVLLMKSLPCSSLIQNRICGFGWQKVGMSVLKMGTGHPSNISSYVCRPIE